MSFEKGQAVVLHDEHSEFDGDVGEVDEVIETMFGDENYIVSFEDGQEQGVPADNLEAADADEE